MKKYGKLLVGICLIFAYLLLVFSFFTGCTKEKELGEMSVVTGFLLDCYDNTYYLYAEVADLNGYEKTSEVTSTYFSATGITLPDAFHRLNQAMPKLPYFSHTKVFLLGKSFQTQSVNPVIRYLMQHREIPSDIPLCIADIDAKKLTEEESVSRVVNAQLERSGRKRYSDLYRIVSESDFSLPEVNLSPYGCNVENTAIFMDGKYQETLVGEDNLAYRLCTEGVTKYDFWDHGQNFLLTSNKPNLLFWKPNHPITVHLQATLNTFSDSGEEDFSLIRKNLSEHLRQITDNFFRRLETENQFTIPQTAQGITPSAFRFQVNLIAEP